MSDKKRESGLFRKKVIDHISSPEDLTAYLKVTSPGVWIVLVAVIALLAGLFAWSMVGSLETTVDAVVTVEDHKARIVTTGQSNSAIKENMSFRIDSKEYVISSVDVDEYGRATAYAEVLLPDGTYVADVVVEQTYPIEFLMESR